MTNVQFFAALGVPFLMFLVSTLSNRSAIGHLGKRMDDFSKRLDDFGKRLDDFSKRLDDMNTGLNHRIDDLRVEMTGRMDRLERKLDSIDTEIRINHDTRLAALEAQVFHRAS